MKQFRFALFATFALGLMILASSATAGTLEETVDRTLPFGPGDRLELDNTNGEIEIATWDRDEIRIEALKKVRSGSKADLEAALESIEVVIDKSAQGVSVETEFLGKSLMGWSLGRVSRGVDYRITLPDHADLDLETVNGQILVVGVHGDLSIETTNGDIQVDRAGGRVSASSTNGEISVYLAEVTDGEDMRFKTTNGSVELLLPAEVRATLLARTTNGSIRSDLPISVHGKLSRSRLEGDINGGGGKIDIRTTNGGIRINEISS